MVLKPISQIPLYRLLLSHIFPLSDIIRCHVVMLVYNLSLWYRFIMQNYVNVRRKNIQHTLIFEWTYLTFLGCGGDGLRCWDSCCLFLGHTVNQVTSPVITFERNLGLSDFPWRSWHMLTCFSICSPLRRQGMYTVRLSLIILWTDQDEIPSILAISQIVILLILAFTCNWYAWIQQKVVSLNISYVSHIH
jgi:hypothetical protein